jgi:hypothetical protein
LTEVSVAEARHVVDGVAVIVDAEPPVRPAVTLTPPPVRPRRARPQADEGYDAWFAGFDDSQTMEPAAEREETAPNGMSPVWLGLIALALLCAMTVTAAWALAS